MVSGRFVKELCNAQSFYMNCITGSKGTEERPFSVQSVQFALQVDEKTYRRDYFRNEDFQGQLYGVSTALGVSVYCSPSKIAIVVAFPEKGFWCYKSFYGEMLKMIERRLRLLMGDSISINRKKKPGDFHMVLIDDIDS